MKSIRQLILILFVATLSLEVFADGGEIKTEAATNPFELLESAPGFNVFLYTSPADFNQKNGCHKTDEELIELFGSLSSFNCDQFRQDNQMDKYCTCVESVLKPIDGDYDQSKYQKMIEDAFISLKLQHDTKNTLYEIEALMPLDLMYGEFPNNEGATTGCFSKEYRAQLDDYYQNTDEFPFDHDNAKKLYHMERQLQDPSSITSKANRAKTYQKDISALKSVFKKIVPQLRAQVRQSLSDHVFMECRDLEDFHKPVHLNDLSAEQIKCGEELTKKYYSIPLENDRRIWEGEGAMDINDLLAKAISKDSSQFAELKGTSFERLFNLSQSNIANDVVRDDAIFPIATSMSQILSESSLMDALLNGKEIKDEDIKLTKEGLTHALKFSGNVRNCEGHVEDLIGIERRMQLNKNRDRIRKEMSLYNDPATNNILFDRLREKFEDDFFMRQKVFEGARENNILDFNANKIYQSYMVNSEDALGGQLHMNLEYSLGRLSCQISKNEEVATEQEVKEAVAKLKREDQLDFIYYQDDIKDYNLNNEMIEKHQTRLKEIENNLDIEAARLILRLRQLGKKDSKQQNISHQDLLKLLRNEELIDPYFQESVERFKTFMEAAAESKTAIDGINEYNSTLFGSITEYLGTPALAQKALAMSRLPQIDLNAKNDTEILANNSSVTLLDIHTTKEEITQAITKAHTDGQPLDLSHVKGLERFSGTTHAALLGSVKTNLVASGNVTDTNFEYDSKNDTPSDFLLGKVPEDLNIPWTLSLDSEVTAKAQAKMPNLGLDRALSLNQVKAELRSNFDEDFKSLLDGMSKSDTFYRDIGEMNLKESKTILAQANQLEKALAEKREIYGTEALDPNDPLSPRYNEKKRKNISKLASQLKTKSLSPKEIGKEVNRISKREPIDLPESMELSPNRVKGKRNIEKSSQAFSAAARANYNSERRHIKQRDAALRDKTQAYNASRAIANDTPNNKQFSEVLEQFKSSLNNQNDSLNREIEREKELARLEAELDEEKRRAAILARKSEEAFKTPASIDFAPIGDSTPAITIGGGDKKAKDTKPVIISDNVVPAEKTNEFTPARNDVSEKREFDKTNTQGTQVNERALPRRLTQAEQDAISSEVVLSLLNTKNEMTNDQFVELQKSKELPPGFNPEKPIVVQTQEGHVLVKPIIVDGKVVDIQYLSEVTENDVKVLLIVEEEQIQSDAARLIRYANLKHLFSLNL